MGVTKKTREQWLERLAKELVKKVAKVADSTAPKKLRVGVGWPSSGRRGRASAECWSDKASTDGAIEITMSLKLDDERELGHILTHELIHAVLPDGVSHGPEFKKVALALGLEGRMTSTTAGKVWDEWAMPAVKKMGPYPGAAFKGMKKDKPDKPTPKMINLRCGCEGYHVRIREALYKDFGPPKCPSGHKLLHKNDK